MLQATLAGKKDPTPTFNNSSKTQPCIPKPCGVCAVDNAGHVSRAGRHFILFLIVAEPAELHQVDHCCCPELILAPGTADRSSTVGPMALSQRTQCTLPGCNSTNRQPRLVSRLSSGGSSARPRPSRRSVGLNVTNSLFGAR